MVVPESLWDCVVCVWGACLDLRWPEPLVGCRGRARVDRRRANERLCRRLDLAAGNRPAHGNPVWLERIWSALGGQPSGEPKPLRRAAYVQYGLTDSLTVYGETAFEHYAIGQPNANTYNGLDYSGLGLRISSGRPANGYSRARRPRSYRAPIIRRRPPRRETQDGRGRRASTPAAISPSLHSRFWLVSGSVPGFLDAEVAYRLRTEGPPDEWHGDLTVGFKFTPKIMLMLQDFTTVSMSTNNPTFPAWRQSVVEASVVYALNDKWSFQVGAVFNRMDGQDQQRTRRRSAVWRNF